VDNLWDEENETTQSLPVIWKRDGLIAIYKPAGLAIHRSKLVRNTREFLVDILVRQLGIRVFPIHRLDRKTSGVMLVALNKKVLEEYSKCFREKKVEKEYLAIVRGHLKREILIDYSLPNNSGVKVTAQTRILPFQHAEIPLPNERYSTSRYTFLKAIPYTGRMHQIRKHLAHINYPIIGDRPHGCNKQNRLLKSEFGMTKMLLHSWKVEVPEKNLRVIAPLPDHFIEGLKCLGFHYK
jgi:tRNA pseudouridine65 synthase